MAAVYQLVVLGHLERHVAEAIEGFSVAWSRDGRTGLVGRIGGQAELHRALRRAQALGIAVVEVVLQDNASAH